MSEDTIGDAIIEAGGSVRVSAFPDRILLNWETLYELVNEPKSFHRMSQSNLHNGQWHFNNVPIITDDDFPSQGFAFQQHCDRCSSGIYRWTVRPKDPIDLIARGCPKCGDTGYVTSFESPDWMAAKPSNKTA